MYFGAILELHNYTFYILNCGIQDSIFECPFLSNNMVPILIFSLKMYILLVADEKVGGSNYGSPDIIT